MELDAMISEICRKVQERVAELEKEEASAEPAAVPSEDNRPALLILAEDHGMRCHPVLESKKLAECYRVDCALLKEEDCDVASYEGVIAFTLTNEALGKIANGIFDTDYTRRFGTALLLGKRIFIAEEEVELYRYRDTAPAGYYSRLEENLKFLQQNGVTIVPLDQLEAVVLGENVPEETEAAPKKEESTGEKEQPVSGATLRLEKRIITERRVIGNIWATRKDENLSGLKLLVVQPLNLLNDQPIDTPIVAADIIGAGVGEKILYVGGSSARGAAGGPHIPVDATIVGIVDDQEVDEALI